MTSIQSESDNLVPSDFNVSNYPNPFNSNTNVVVKIPVSGNLSIKVYNVIGEEITELVNEYHNTGTYKFLFNANELSSGVYLLRVSINDFYYSHKILLMK